MKLIAEITDNSFDQNYDSPLDIRYRLRRASRAVLRYKDKIALLNVTANHYHKLPGGGVEEGESVTQALQRELLEETGCQAEIKQEIGITVEVRDQINLIQISYVYFAEVIGEPGEISLTEKEKAQGFRLEWVNFDQLANLLKQDNPQGYVDKFISQLDQEILKIISQQLPA